MSNACLYTLPVELLHRIIDYLDTETVFLSFRNVCKNFHAIVNSYNQHQLDFRWISKSAFYRIRHLVRPDQITVLVLSNDDTVPNQTELFLSLFDLSQFTRLRSVSLLEIKKKDLVTYLEHLPTISLVSLSVIPAVMLNKCEQIDTQILTLCKLRHLSLTWTTSPSRILDILLSLPFLETFVLDGLISRFEDGRPPPATDNKSKLKSLSMNFYSSDIHEITSILQYTPSLINLKLTGSPIRAQHIWDGSWWTDFIQVYLPELKTFQFFFENPIQYSSPRDAIESIISSFKTTFWLNKQLHIVCDYYTDTHELKLYTIPICKTVLSYRETSKQISSSNVVNPTTSLIMNNVSLLVLKSNVSINKADSQHSQFNGPLFPRVSNLKFILTSEFSNDTLHYLSRLVDLSHLNTLSIVFDLNEQSLHKNQIYVQYLLERVSNLRKICLRSTRLQHFIEYYKILCPMINNRITNLKVDIMSVEEFEYVFERFQHCPNITVQLISYCYSEWEKFLKRLQSREIDFTVRYLTFGKIICFSK